MDRQLLERLTGAAVLVVGLVIIAPAILNGPDDPADASRPVPAEIARDPAAAAETRRMHTIRLDAEQDGPPVARAVPPAAEPAQSGNEATSAVKPSGQTVTETAPQQVEKPASQPAPQQVEKPTSQPAPAEPVRTAAPAPKEKSPPPAAPVSPRPPAAVVPADGWVVQLGSFSSQANAQQLTDSVSQKGFPAFMMSVDRAGKKLYRVRVGPKESRPQAEELAVRLNKAGFAGQVTQQ